MLRIVVQASKSLRRLYSGFCVWLTAARNISYDHTLYQTSPSTALCDWSEKDLMSAALRANALHHLLRGNTAQADIIPRKPIEFVQPLKETMKGQFLFNSFAPPGGKYVFSIGGPNSLECVVWNIFTQQLVASFILDEIPENWDIGYDGEKLVLVIHQRDV